MKSENVVPSAAWEVWTPERAAQTLKDQEAFGEFANRAVKLSIVRRYAKDMAAGRWLTNGETIVFNGARCLDGQHRLRACWESGVTMMFLTVRSVDPSAMATLDSGIIRTPGDVLRGSRGQVVGGYYNAVAAAARIVFMYSRHRSIYTSPEKYPTRSDLVEIIDEHPGIVASVQWMNTSTSRTAISRSKVISAWHYLCGRRYPVERDVFFADLVAGVNLETDSPVRVLRERMLMERGRGRAGGVLPAAVLSAFVVKAWNAELTGRPIKILRHRADEAFPILHGDE
jgi:hypothetical protein